MFGEIKQAWTFWMLANQSFGSSLVAGWSYDNKSGKMPHKLQNKRDNFTQEYAIHLQNVQIECCDALRLILSRDCGEVFFYLDPPYFQANMGHYGGYTAQHFENLLVTLSEIKGFFLLSSYPCDILADYVGSNNWQSVELAGSITITTNKKTFRKAKTEVLTANYDLC